jgi:hypothetical protein
MLVENLDVFSEGADSWLTWANYLHRVTAKDVISREVLLQPGDRWNWERIDESVRRIRNPFLSNVVVILPIETAVEDEVDILVVTRDVWSLRVNTDFEAQGDSLLSLSASLAENNFLGWRKGLSYRFIMNQGQMATGPSYSDPNVAGTRMTLSASASALFGRDSGEFEGTSSDMTLAYPLWQLASNWGGSLRIRHFEGPVRVFQGTSLFTYDAPETQVVESIPWEYRYRLVQGTAQAIYQAGTFLKQRLSFGVDVYTTAASVLADETFPDELRASFERDVLPRQETSTALFIHWRMFQPKWATLRDLATFDLREDYLVGPEFSWRIAQALRVLGSDVNFTTISTYFSYAVDPGFASYLKFRADWRGRLQGSEVIDQQVTASAYYASPMIAKAFRIIMRGLLTARYNDTTNTFLTAGGGSGLRGYGIGVFRGTRRVIGNVELRSAPLPLWFVRLGGVLYWDGGHAANAFDDLRLHQNVGLGLRLLIPQINPYVIRVDWAFPVTSGFPAWPGRVSFGFKQVF